jgi:hypothetical protein
MFGSENLVVIKQFQLMLSIRGSRQLASGHVHAPEFIDLLKSFGEKTDDKT